LQDGTLACPPVLIRRGAASGLLLAVPLPLALQTAADAAAGVSLFGLDIASLQQWTLIYLGLSSLAFVLVWVIGFLRR
jgi:hypothetical protein